ncbi:DNA polymerase III subunit gamma/tau [Sphingomonas solaris]|uniref:DNA polymerase III subunit gamma/tau n=1 Tax=Alterirhizorhabdus solaris TaxID=2529389 RepID=A0A558QX13_9SPHN|nr:DNA polymerase III subunit gamma/tau [Sphingomonas solaris]TVV71607.1 DNA polymerase III subunit gamma/tau [Sphingomonas solaris]
MSESPPPYRVLARKYRPQRFAELIGQAAMVTTLGNAIKRDRLAHAFLLTGVRGVGKTSTARLIAKALNCIGVDGQGGPTIDPCGVCEPCVAIAEGRHIDVVEMDAASHTGVDDVREIIEAVRYSAVSARYKVYIIDEVHMLSKNAFNALLKTLEEPPAHVKFLFATTEVNKVPVTVLSRCQRFDLRRIPADTLAAHFAHVVTAEAVEAEPEALALIARAAEGSARDGLSILDQAIAHGTGLVTAGQVRDMLGLSDRGAIRALFGDLLRGDAPAVLAGVRAQHDLGVEPVALLHGLLETTHGVTRAKVGGGDDPALSVEEREALADWASRLGFATLHRLWQLLLKGHGEVQAAALPLEAAEMALLRVVHASTLPDPGELARRIAGGEVAMPAAPALPSAVEEAQASLMKSTVAAAPPRLPADVVELEAMLGGASEHLLAQQVHDYARVIRFEPPVLDFAAHPRLDEDFTRRLMAVLRKATQQIWTVSLAEAPEAAAPSLYEQQQATEADERARVLAMPVVQAALAAFPDAALESYTPPHTQSPERSAHA